MNHTTASFETHSLTIELPIDVAEQLAQTHENGLEGAAVAALQLWLKLGEKHLGIAHGYALAHGISTHAAIKKAITKVLDEKAPKASTTIPMQKLRGERDADIYRRAMLGVKRKQLAQDYGISEIRVHQIIALGKKNDPKNSPQAKNRVAEVLQDWDEPL
jgi:hypothetical protein